MGPRRAPPSGPAREASRAARADRGSVARSSARRAWSWSLSLPACRALLLDLPRDPLRRGGGLREPDVVPERIAKRAVDPVRPLGGLLRELDASLRELVVGLAAIVRREEQVAPRPTLGQEVADLGRGLVVHDRLARPLQQDRAAGVTGYADGQPAHEAQILVVPLLETELPHVEVER